MNLTIAYLEEKFNFYNDKYFGGSLTMPKFIVTNNVRQLGQYQGRSNAIKVSSYYDRTEKEICQTLIHEMIHEWQWQIYRNVNHGYTFKSKASIINRDGWDIDRLTKVDTDRYRAENLKECSVVYGYRNGILVIGRVKSGYESSICKMLKGKKFYTHLCIGKSCSPLVNTLVEGRTTYHYRPVTTEDISNEYNVYDIRKVA